MNLHNLALLILESVSLVIVFPELVPLGVGSIDVQPSVSAIKRLSVRLNLDGSGLPVESEYLRISSVWSLDNSSVANKVNISVLAEHRNNVERSIDA
jgi:hypothetical protein